MPETNEKPASVKPAKDKKQLTKEIKFYSYAVIIFLLLFVVLSNCFVRVPISGDSMAPSFHSGQTVWANKWRKPVYGSVIVLKNPYYGTDPAEPQNLLKRVRGFAGDKFWFDENNNLWRQTANGAKTRIQINVEQSRLDMIFLHSNMPQFESIFPNYNVVYTVPEDCIFVLGDNMNNSEDSRYYGGASIKNVIGVIYD